jgi:hypothetical protein
VERADRGELPLTPKEYLRGVLIAADQLGNALLAGPADETISSRLAREDVVPILGPAVRFALNRIDPNHTEDSLEYDDLGLPAPHHLPGLGRAALDQVMLAGDSYLSLPEAKLRMAEQEAKLDRLKQDGATNCKECGRYL